MTKRTKTPEAEQTTKATDLFCQEVPHPSGARFESYFSDSETIADPLYGMIDISSFEKRLIACREMQRLREIRQLGVAHLVYPAAEHSRFTHSLGVCYQSKRLIDRVNSNLAREPRYRDWREHGFYRGASAAPSPLRTIARVERIVISAAALLHDLSHGPFSHDMEPPRGAAHYNQLPEHDAFSENPAFFRYLFEKAQSQVAFVIDEFNEVFWREGVSSAVNGGNWAELIKLKTGKEVTTDGYVLVAPGSIIRQGKVPSPYERLPILGVMIFEIHLFEKEPSWLKTTRDEKTKRVATLADQDQPQTVVTDWKSAVSPPQTEAPPAETPAQEERKPKEDHPSLAWLPLAGWFRPYRKEIIGNTICSDLIDYIERDGYNTGILSHVDLKFLDRMVVTRAVLGDGQAVDLSVDWGRVPETCEHVVFDIYDHKRGFIRQSVITEILACLHARYLLCERVYQHRVTEGGRAMIQEIARGLCNANILSGAVIHGQPPNAHDCSVSGDTAFLAWVWAQDEAKLPNDEAKAALRTAKQLASMLRERRVYREAVIIDGVHGFESPGSMAGAEKNCEALAEVLLPQALEKRRALASFIDSTTAKLKKKWGTCGRNPAEFPEQPLLIGIREFGKRYKVPLVLVAKPFHSREDTAPIEIQPLFVCADPPHIKNQLEAMKAAYASLWRVYLFIHPGFHQAGEAETDVHKMLEKDFLDFLRKETKLTWRNSVKITQLLPSEAIDICHFIQDKERQRQKPVIAEVAGGMMLKACAKWLNVSETDTTAATLAKESAQIIVPRILKDWNLFHALSDAVKRPPVVLAFEDQLAGVANAARIKEPKRAAEEVLQILQQVINPAV